MTAKSAIHPRRQPPAQARRLRRLRAKWATTDVTHPQYLYYAAIAVMVVLELVLRRRAFGPQTWVIAVVFAASYLACQVGIYLPGIQLPLHIWGFVVGLCVSRNVIDQCTAAVFVPLATLDAMQLTGYISLWAWWWAVYYTAFAQLTVLGAGGEFHPLGRKIRAWAQEVKKSFECHTMVGRLWKAI